MASLHLKHPHPHPSAQYEDPNTITTNIMLELRKLGLPTEFSQSKIKQGWGDEVCATLNNLARMALKAVRWKWEAPVFPPEAEEAAADDDGGDDADAAAMEMDAQGLDDDEVEEEDDIFADDDEAFIDTDATKDLPSSKAAGILESSTTHAEWKLELERVLPQLKVHIRADAKDWRNHLDLMRTNRTDIETALEATTVGRGGGTGGRGGEREKEKARGNGKRGGEAGAGLAFAWKDSPATFSPHPSLLPHLDALEQAPVGDLQDAGKGGQPGKVHQQPARRARGGVPRCAGHARRHQ